ncbi:MAG: fumarate reductase/succinate dehydrogenase flavoprotein-like protein [Thermoleophilia bacterium]|nr:fumarate reductase/succinate dehydrogenase flavoprotein-like protein [Thermoleophilia bacterium]
MTRPLVAVVGAGLAGLVAAVSAHAAGADVVVLERDEGPGGATAASAGWIWRYRDIATARLLAPRGDHAIHEVLVSGLDDSLAWLEGQGVRLIARGTGRSFTDGARIDPVQALGALADRLPDDAVQRRTAVVDARRASGGGHELLVRRARPGGLAAAPPAWVPADAVVFCGGGYALDHDRIARESRTPPQVSERWLLRAPRGGDGTSMAAALALGAVRMPGTGECMTRLAIDLDDATSPESIRVGELLVPDATLLDGDGAPIERAQHDWSGALAAWDLARRSGRGRVVLPRAALRTELHAGTVEDALRAAIAAGAMSGRTGDGGVWLDVAAGITHTRCGLRIDPDGRLLEAVESRIGRRTRERALPRAFAAGMDAADVGLGGTASGLAQALVFGRRAGAAAVTS